MTVKQALIDYNVSLAAGNKWLVFDGNEWVLFCRPKFSKRANIIYRGNESEAVKLLVKDL